ncbi:MAG: DUF2256 domain-containing protein [Granulosicoccus sp.]
MKKNQQSQSKICPVCDRPFFNRRKWQARGLWPEIIYCSQRCRNNRSKREQAG